MSVSAGSIGHLGAAAAAPCRCARQAAEHPDHVGQHARAAAASWSAARRRPAARRTPPRRAPAGAASTTAPHDRGAARRRAARRPMGYGDPARPSFSALVEAVEHALAGDGSASSSSRRTPSRCRASGLGLGAEDPQPDRAPSSTSAGKPRTSWPARVCVKDCSIGAEGPRRLAGARRARCRRRPRPSPAANCGRSGALSASRSLPAGLLRAVVVDAPGRSGAGARAPWTSPRPRAARRRRSSTGRCRSRASSSGSSPGGHGGEELAGRVGRRHEADPQVLGQAADQAGDQLLAQAGDVPGEVVGVDPVEGGDRHVDGEAVVGGARLEVVADREGQPLAARLPAARGSRPRVTSSAVSWVSIAGSKVSRSGRVPALAASTTGRSGRR